ncbi:MAG: signal recognition particle-docking protein FtsY [Nitrososphaeria archaeon]
MFEKLRNTFSLIISNLSKHELSEKEINKVLEEMILSLVECDIAYEVAAEISENLKNMLLGKKVSNSELKDIVRENLRQILLKIFYEIPKIDIIERINEKKKLNLPFVILFLGINGTGKTTTLAKVAYLLKKKGYSVVLVCGDTHRAGSIEQLKQHAMKLGLKTIEQKYGADPAAVARDGVTYAKTHKVDVVLIDSAGRIQTDKNLMDELLKIVRVVSPDIKIFVGDALAGNDAVSQSKEFLKYTSFDGVILTKMDADAKGGSAISIVYATKRPILFIGTGQNYEDLEEFVPEKLVDHILLKE